jgi:MraZ protein
MVKSGKILIMFRGIKKIKIDAKGRMAMPTKYREQLTDVCGGQTIMTVDPDGCLSLYPVAVWEQIEHKLSKMPSLNSRARRLKRLLVGHATDIEWDGQGRILIPPELREFASITKNAVMIGQMQKFELWDETIWNDRRDKWKQEELEEEGIDMPSELEDLVY